MQGNSVVYSWHIAGELAADLMLFLYPPVDLTIKSVSMVTLDVNDNTGLLEIGTATDPDAYGFAEGGNGTPALREAPDFPNNGLVDPRLPAGAQVVLLYTYDHSDSANKDVTVCLHCVED